MPKRRSSADIWPTLVRFLPYMAVYWKQLTFIFMLVLVVAGCDLLRPYLIGHIIDAANESRPWGSLLNLLEILLLITIGRSLTLLTRNFLTQVTGMRITCDMRVATFQHLQSLSLRFYDARHTGKIVARVSNDASALHTLVTGASVNLLGDIVTILVALGVLMHANWKLAIVTYAILPFFVINYVWHRRRLRVESRKHRQNWDRVMSFLHERIASTRLIRAFATEEEEVANFRRGIEADFVNYNRVAWRNTLLGVGADFLAGFGIFVVLAYGSYLVITSNGAFKVGELTAFLFYIGLLYTPITRIVDANAAIQLAATALEKIFALFDTQPHIPENDQLPQLANVDGKVDFANVSFAYRTGHTTLHDINFSVESGQTVALVGPSGSGKSTIITLLARFYDPTAGAILIDGQDIRNFNVQSVRKQIGIVMQDNILFSGSIAENIKYGRPGSNDEEMIEAARAANAHDFIQSLPRGYDTWIGERGVQLSGGQRQRIAIARVILKNPRILILDEATSALDTESERLVQEALDRLMQKRTSIVIAHRLSTIINAGTILVLKDGRIVERGSHADLLAHGGLYGHLHNLQFTKKASV